MPVNQKKRAGVSTPSEPPCALRIIRAGIIVRKMPMNRAATSRMGNQVNSFFSRVSLAEVANDPTAQPIIMASRSKPHSWGGERHAQHDAQQPQHVELAADPQRLHGGRVLRAVRDGLLEIEVPVEEVEDGQQHPPTSAISFHSPTVHKNGTPRR